MVPWVGALVSLCAIICVAGAFEVFDFTLRAACTVFIVRRSAAVLRPGTLCHPSIQRSILAVEAVPCCCKSFLFYVCGDRMRVVIFDGDSLTESDITAFGAHGAQLFSVKILERLSMRHSA